MIKTVEISRRAQKDLKKVPVHIGMGLRQWVASVEKVGLETVQKQLGYHDEALKGQRKGQRSIRLNRSYRAIYRVVRDSVQFILIDEVNKHDY